MLIHPVRSGLELGGSFPATAVSPAQPTPSVHSAPCWVYLLSPTPPPPGLHTDLTLHSRASMALPTTPASLQTLPALRRDFQKQTNTLVGDMHYETRMHRSQYSTKIDSSFSAIFHELSEVTCHIGLPLDLRLSRSLCLWSLCPCLLYLACISACEDSLPGPCWLGVAPEHPGPLSSDAAQSHSCSGADPHYPPSPTPPPCFNTSTRASLEGSFPRP